MKQTVERELELTLPMVPDIEIAAARAAANLARQAGMSAERIDEMAHAIVEACINAREHSYCEDHRIHLRLVVGSTDSGRQRIDVWVTDHGRGFDAKAVRARRRQAASGSPQRRGWGLQIMEAHMDEVSIDSDAGGTTIHMVKYGE